MTTLDLVKKDKVMLAIAMKAEEAGFIVMEASSYKVVVKAGCLPVSITWEMCLCHGGRMWLSQANTNIYVELSSPEYDTKNGIVDTETQKIRKPKNPSEWFYCQVVYVYETNPWAIDGIQDGYMVSQEMIDGGTIKEGTRCRCWLGFFRV